MRPQHKPVHRRKGSVSIEAALFMIVGGVMLFGIVTVITEMRDYYRLNTLTAHVGQVVARSDTLSSTTIEAILNAATSDTLLNDLTGLCVTVANKDKTLYTVPGACPCASQTENSSTIMSSLQSAASNMAVVVVNGCDAKYQSTSVFTTTATMD